jgi:proteasome lid subunit RPN8/RPN11
MRDQYQYALELERLDHTALGQLPVTVDWEPAWEWARFMALRASNGGAQPSRNAASVEPLWEGGRGEPYVGGVRVSVAGKAPGPESVVLPVTYFRHAAQQLTRGLVAKKLLQPREEFDYSVVAFRAPRPEPARPALALTVEDVQSPLVVKPASGRELFARSALFGTAHPDDVPVFIPQRVLDDAAALTRAAEAAETAGILIGHVCRDAERQLLLVETTDLIPAKHTRSETTQVTFTADTWTAAEAAIRLRNAGEVMVGWFHSHPAKYWCSPKCPPETRRDCPLARNFFSGEDCALHRAVFPMAYCVALVVTHAETGLRNALYGWRHGLIVQRGFHVLNASPDVAGGFSSEAIIGENHEEACP